MSAAPTTTTAAQPEQSRWGRAEPLSHPPERRLHDGSPPRPAAPGPPPDETPGGFKELPHVPETGVGHLVPLFTQRAFQSARERGGRPATSGK